MRTKLATSHEGRYSYWLDPTDRYIYQRDERTSEWIGWMCAQSVWETGFGSAWMVPV